MPHHVCKTKKIDSRVPILGETLVCAHALVADDKTNKHISVFPVTANNGFVRCLVHADKRRIDREFI